jgi:hypothetical protein
MSRKLSKGARCTEGAGKNASRFTKNNDFSTANNCTFLVSDLRSDCQIQKTIAQNFRSRLHGCKVVSGFHSRPPILCPKSLKAVAFNFVYISVCFMFLCPRYAWIVLVETPALTS